MDNTRDIVTEAYALALEGRSADALRLLEAAPPGEPAELARARIMSGYAGSTGRKGRELLDSLPESVPTLMARARCMHRTGDTPGAARIAKQALDALRAAGHDAGPFGKLLSLEVENLRRPSNEAPVGPYSTDDLLALIDLGRRLAGTAPPEEVLRTVLREAIRITGADRGFVVRTITEPFEFAAAQDVDHAEVRDPGFEVSRTLIRQVAKSGDVELLTMADLPDHHPASQSLGVVGVRSVACLPLGSLGVLYLDARRQNNLLEPSRLPFLELLASQIAAALEAAERRREKELSLERAAESLRRERSRAEPRVAYDDLIGASAPMREVYDRLDRILPTSEPVIVEGETGTGKELVARLIHRRGPRNGKEFVTVNCAGLSESLLESELFGHERGAFTGADRSRPGLLEVADGGTLFLDEIADMPARMQGDLLRALQSGEVRRLGGREVFHVDVRIVAATNRDLAGEVEAGRFRADLYYRLNVLKLALPPLRERPDDVPLLIEKLLPSLAGDGPVPTFERHALARLQSHSWPGNVRELQNVLRRILVLGRAKVDVSDLPPELASAAPVAWSGTLQELEDRAVRGAMERTRGNKSRAAKQLGVDRKTLYAKLRRLGLH